MARALVRILGGFLAVLATSTLLCLQVITAAHVDDASLRPVTIVAASLQSAVLVVLLWLAASHIFQTGRVPSSRCLYVIFGFELLACALAAAVSAVALAHLSISRADQTPPPAEYQAQLLAGSSVALVLATALQLVLMILHFISSRELVVGRADPAEMPADDQRTCISRVKSIPYAQTRTGSDQTIREMASVERPAPLVIAEPSAGTKAGFFSSPFAQVIRPSSSKTKLLPAGERRPSSRESTPRGSSVEETSFDSWDTSSVDTHNRQVVLEMSSSPSAKPRGLETIPASPRPSRSPSPRTATDLEPPRSLRTRRSYSPSTLRQREDARLTASSSVDELHIHPLFRSDSQTPAPLASPGTSVLASPNAGQVISRRESMQSLARMRSGSLRSPLSHQPSLESTKLKIQGDGQQVDERDEDDEAGLERTSSGGDRRMTPPVPAWLLSPGPQSGFDPAVLADVKRTA
ncbi:hypothetical protein HRG_005507 [Hirsutella rhossiliensis]|uniref:Uncharacterized protein n=1 Tax=Hirsutella rhossiliensis TaxID=111463 RepID=A0A9P8N1H5_9HYPO|nr:uncharacterized protein HRG_05507 [Hirsutella rhossiliensis]KAH0962997.1 hypothetical protein HRG_05507 [Hirsutella rhossiliensis]